MQVADAIAGQSLLAAAALAVQAHVDVLLPFGQSRPAGAFFITIAGSGDRKSSPDNEALWPIRQHEKSLREKYADDLKVWKLASAAWAATKKKIETRDKISIAERLDLLVQLGPEPEKPISPVLTTCDVTPDGLTKNWLHMRGALGVFSAEGATFTAGHGMSEDGKLRTAAMLSELWDGKPITRVRAGDGVSQLVGRRLSAHLMVQPDAAGAFLADPVLRDQGFLSRVLVAAPLSIAGSRAYSDPRPEDEAQIRAYGARLLSILETPPPLATDVVNELAPRPVPMSLEAKELWIAFLDEVESRQGPDGDLRPIRDFASKAAEHAARLAVILAALRNLAVSEISADAMDCGIALCRFYLSEALRLAGAVKADPRIERALALLTWLQKQSSTEISTSAVMQSGPPVARAKASLDDAIAVLIDHGWVAEVCKRPRRLRLKKRM